MADVIERATPFLNQCGSCDAGLPMACTCPTGDFRPVMLNLVREVERLRAEAEKERKYRDDEDDRMQRYFDRIAKSRAEATRRAETAEAEVRRIQQAADAYRMSAIEHAGEVSERDAELAVERERSARLAWVIEKLGGDLIAQDEAVEHGDQRCVASKHIPTTGAVCSVCGAAGMQHEDDRPGGDR